MSNIFMYNNPENLFGNYFSRVLSMKSFNYKLKKVEKKYKLPK